ncbi:MAG: repeat-containing protein [Phycisphaerales bacterium]|nr:repeat-containing protein [Phycisphaerales bacterium]
MNRSSQPQLFDDGDEQSAFVGAATRFAEIADDLPFVPEGPYEPRRRQLAWRAFLIIAMAVAAFAPSLSGGWLWLDDQHILSDLALRTGRGLGTIWTEALQNNIAPATRTLWWLEFHIFNATAESFRAVSLLLHCLTACIAWLAMRRLGITGAWLIAAVFAIHPVALPNVAWVSRQGDLLGAAASMLAFLAFLRVRQIQPPADERGWTDPFFSSELDETPPAWPWVIFAIAAIVSVLTGSATGVVAALGMMFIERRRHTETPWPIWAALAMFAAGSVAGRALFPGVIGIATDEHFGFLARIVEAAAALPWTMFQTFWPVDSAFLFDRSQWALPAWIVSFAVITIALALLPTVWRRISLYALAGGALLCILDGLSFSRGASETVLAADLLPYALQWILIAIFLAILFRRIRRNTGDVLNRSLRWGVGIGVLIGLGIPTYLRSENYVSADELLQHTLALNPDSLSARIELSKRYVAESYLEEASTQLDRVPEDRRVNRWLMIRGQVFDAQKKYSEAVICYKIAHERSPADQPTTISLAEAQNNAGHADQAASLYEELISRGTADPGLLTNAGLTQVRLGRAQAAADLYQKALDADPRYLPAHINLANVLFELGKYEDASNHLQQAVKIDPRNFPAFMNAGILLYRLHDSAKAERMFRAALSIDSTSADAFDNLGITLAAQDKLPEAAWSFTQATRLSPDHAAKDHLTEVRRQMKSKAATQPGP